MTIISSEKVRYILHLSPFGPILNLKSLGYFEIKQLNSGSHTGPCYNTLGFNPRGYIAYVSGILINIVGFVRAIEKLVPAEATRIFDFTFFAGLLLPVGCIECYVGFGSRGLRVRCGWSWEI